MPSEEITDRVAGLPVHLNATNLKDHLPPMRGATVLEAIENDLLAVREQARRSGRPMIAQLNHPNFGWAVTAADLAAATGLRLFEVYNGHPLVNGAGDASRPGSERLWDLALSARLAGASREPLYGLAVDDAHDFAGPGEGRRPGRGWVWVLAPELSAEALVAALEAGDFYASTGVTLKRLSRGGGRISLEVEAEEGVSYLTQFVGTRAGGEPGGPAAGIVLAEARGRFASYALRGDELYVRARVVSSRLKADPAREGEVEMAWVQPLLGAGR